MSTIYVNSTIAGQFPRIYLQVKAKFDIKKNEIHGQLQKLKCCKTEEADVEYPLQPIGTS